MTYRDLIASLAESSRLQKSQVEVVLYHLVRAVPEAARAGRLRVPELGTFMLRTRKGRRIRNPSTKELQVLPAVKTLGFRAAKAAKARVAR